MRLYKKIALVSLLLLSVLYVFGEINASTVNSSFKSTKSNAQDFFKNGDIIFQTSESKQCEAVRIATNSKFSHCGIIFIENGTTFVYEAAQPVKMTPLKQWITHGRDGKYVVKRLKNADSVLTASTLKKMKQYLSTFQNKDYDLYFEWSDEKIYCSELVWKIYKNAGEVELCALKSLKDFNLKDPMVQKIMKERYGNKIPYMESVVAPSQLYESDLLETIFDNY
jgi:hypothetical protein